MSRIQRAEPTGRMALLDGLRLLAALIVVLFHLTAWRHAHWNPGESIPARESWPVLSQFSVYGNLGVQLFFIISGLVVFRSMEGRSPAQFVGSRVGRLFPAFWVAVLFTGILQMLFWRVPQPDLAWGDVALNLSMIGPPIIGRPWVDGVFWTLWVEARFYFFLLILLVVAKDRVQAYVWFSIVWPAVSTMGMIATNSFGPVDPALDAVLMPAFSGLFAGGMLLHIISRHGLTILRGLGLALAVVQGCWAAAVSMPIDTYEATGLWIPGWHFALAVLLLFLLTAAVSLGRLRMIDWKWLTVAGALTYPMYLFHQVPGWFLISKLAPVLPHWITLMITLTSLVAVSWIINRFIERNLGRRLSRSTRNLLDGIVRSARGKTRSSNRAGQVAIKEEIETHSS